MYFIHTLLEQHIKSMVCCFKIIIFLCLNVKIYKINQKSVDKDNSNLLSQILGDLGSAPAQLPRKENANVDLELDNSIKGGSEKVYTADQTYAETKFLLYTVMKSLRDTKLNFNTVDEFLEQAFLSARKKGNHNIADNITRIKENIRILVSENLISTQDDYLALRKDAAIVCFFFFFLLVGYLFILFFFLSRK